MQTNDIDSLCDNFNYNTTVIWKPTKHFINDIDIIIEEISNIISLDNLSIYDVCVSCGNSLTWDQEYFITTNDYNWLISEGKVYFFTELRKKYFQKHTREFNIEEYNILNIEFNRLTELFSLQIGD